MGRPKTIPNLGKKLAQIGCLAGFTAFFYAELLNPGTLDSILPVFLPAPASRETEASPEGTERESPDSAEASSGSSQAADTLVPTMEAYLAAAHPGISYHLNPSVPVRASWSGLTDTLSAMLASYEGVWSVSVRDLSTGQGIALNDTPQASASLIKLFIMGAVLEAADRGALEYSQEIEQLLREMITVSDNDAANELIRYLDPDHDHRQGLEAVNAYIRETGCSGTILNNGLADPELWYDPDSPNQTTALDCVEFLTAVYEGRCVSHLMSHRMEALLMEQEILYKIPSALPEETVTASKSGETDDTENDAAIVYSPGGDYVICVMATGLSDNDLAVEQIRDISETVYRFFNTSVDAGLRIFEAGTHYFLVSPYETADYSIVLESGEAL